MGIGEAVGTANTKGVQMMYKVTYIYNGSDDYYLGDGGQFSTLEQAKAAVNEILQDLGHGVETISIKAVNHE